MDSCSIDLDKIKLVLYQHGYEFVEQVGEGGYGSCFRVYSKQYDQTFVCKTISQHFAFEQELNALKQLNHQNVIKIYKYFHEFNYYFLILEDCTGGNIYDYITTHELKESDILKLTFEIVDALNYLHEKGIAHLDIKPANVLLDKYGRAKLCDFGLARKDHGSSCNQFSGTRCFMAPEVVQKLPYNSFKADVWSLGMTLYFLAFKCLPFTNKVQWAQFVEYGQYKTPKFVNSEFKEILRMCIQPNPEKRASMSEIRAMIRLPQRVSAPNIVVPKPRMFMRATHVAPALSFNKLPFHGLVQACNSQIRFTTFKFESTNM